MSIVSSQQWVAGFTRILAAETEQAALDALVALCTALTGAASVAVVRDRTVLLYSPHSPAQSQHLGQLLHAAFGWLGTPTLDSDLSGPLAEAAVCLPLDTREQQFGVLCIAADPALLGNHAAELDTLILAFTQTLKRLRHLAEAQLLAELSTRLGSTRDPTALLQQVLDLINRAFGVAASRICLRDERAGNLVVMAGTPADRVTGLVRMPLAGTIAGYVMRHEHGLLCAGTGPEGLQISEQETGVAAGHVLCVPLKYSGRAFGALMLSNARSAPSFTEDDMRFLTTIASMVAVLIANARLYVRAVRDALTGAYNRGAFNNALDQSWRRAQRRAGGFSLILIDLDDFKRINDRFGHSIGDQVLQSVTRILWEALRTDDLIFRYGGEEFCVLLADVAEPRIAMAIAERLRAALDCSLLVTGVVQVQISASVGLAIHPLHGATSSRKLLDIADDAAYQAKRDGKNRVVMAAPPAPLAE